MMIIQNLGSAVPATPPSGDGSILPSVPSAGATAPAAVPPGLPPASTAQGGQGASTQNIAQVQAAVNSINQSMQFSNRGLTFSVDQSTKETVVKVVEDGTGTVIKQIPSEQALAIAKAIDDSLQQEAGSLIRQKA
jgi:flagellar protein FlaG